MKKLLLVFAVVLLSVSESFSQASFNTGGIEVYVNQYGRIRLYAADGIQQLERASILVGVSETEVFDYTNDSEELDPTELVANPTLSDFEIYGSYDNAYSELPPEVIVKLNAYGWNSGSYCVVRFTVINDDANSMTASMGLDIIPFINEEYGFDTVTFLGDDGVIRFHRGNQMNLGMKLLSASLTSLYSFEWYDGYSLDSDLWTWMNSGSLQPEYISTTIDGPVSITSQAPVLLAPDASFEVFYAMALGVDETEMLANMATADEKYNAWFTSVNEIGPNSKGLVLGKNYPNPFNEVTTINYQLPQDGFVSLKIYDAIGNEVSSLVNSKQASGAHSIDFDAAGLAAGVYYYTLKIDNLVKTNKMVISR